LDVMDWVGEMSRCCDGSGEKGIGPCPVCRRRLKRVDARVPDHPRAGPSAIRIAVQVLRTVLQVAEDAELIPNNPAVRIRTPRETPKPKHVFSIEQRLELARVV